MCMKTPDVSQPAPKDPAYLRNPFLDGRAIGAGAGRNSLRIDLASPAGGRTGFNDPGVGIANPNPAVIAGGVNPGVVVPRYPLPFRGSMR